MSSLDGVYAKLDRACEHATELKQTIDAAFEATNQKITREVSADGSKVVYRVEMLPTIDPRWSLLLGDFLTNMRAALDHLAWQLVVLDGGTPTCKTSFPIKTSWLSRSGNSPAKPLTVVGLKSETVLDLVEAVQPRSLVLLNAVPENSPLHVLNELVNIDKHRLLLLFAHTLRWNRMWFGVPVDRQDPKYELNTAPLADGDILATFDFGDSAVFPNFDPQVTLGLGLNVGLDIAPLRSAQVLQTVQMIYSTVEHSVISEHFASLFGVEARHSARAFKSQ